MSMLEDVKVALQVATQTYDSELSGYIESAKVDIQAAGITNIDESDAGIHQIIILFCKYRFELIHGNAELAQAVKEAYDEQKAQLGMRTGYTDFGEDSDGNI